MSTVKDGREIVFNRVRVIKRSFKRETRFYLCHFVESPFLLCWVFMVSHEEKAEGRFSEFRWEICVRVGLDPVSRGWPGWDGIWKIRKRICIVCY